MKIIFTMVMMVSSAWVGVWGAEVKPGEPLAKTGNDVITTTPLLAQYGDAITTNPQFVYYMAAMMRDGKSVHALKNRGVNINARGGEYMHTALHAMVLDENTTAAGLLLEAGADPKVPNGNTLTPLFDAVNLESYKMVGMLLEAGANPNVPEPPNHHYPLHAAASIGDTTCTLLLLEHKAEVNVRDYLGVTPLQLAANARAPRTLKLLLDHGADPTLKSEQGRTALDVAKSLDKNEKCVKLLEEAAKGTHPKTK